MKTLVVTESKSLEIREVDIPEFSERQALVRMVCCGICNGTDAKLIHHTFKGFGEDAYPLMLGHEAVGQVIATGSKVTSYKEGDYVLLPFVDEVGNDRNLKSGWGGFSEYGVIHDAAAYPQGEAPECAYAQTVLPDFVNPVDASMIITLREVLSSIKRFGIQKGQSVAVFGCGPVGLTFIQFMKLLGVGPIIALDVIEEKVKEGLAKGADYAYDSTQIDVKECVRKICPQGVDYVLDAVGVLSIINQGMELIRDGGKICCYGISPHCSMELNWEKAPYNWQVQFQQFPSKVEEGECTDTVLGWLKDGTIDLKDFISDYFPFEKVLEAFEKLERREIKKKGIVVF
ncbi:MAG: zinc-binding dehydrogenase [Clostridium sp.]|nr:zinc-binding dehydrogenase [Clostridium sp.]